MAAALGDRASQPTDVVRRIYDDIAQYVLEPVRTAVEPVAALHHAVLDHSRRLCGGGIPTIVLIWEICIRSNGSE